MRGSLLAQVLTEHLADAEGLDPAQLETWIEATLEKLDRGEETMGERMRNFRTHLEVWEPVGPRSLCPSPSLTAVEDWESQQDTTSLPLEATLLQSLA